MSTTYKGANCDCEGMDPPTARRVDLACGKARQFAKDAQQKLAAQDGAAATALKHHFKLDQGAARGIGRAVQQYHLDYIASVFRKIESDLAGRMTYVRASGWNPFNPGGQFGVAFTMPVNPRVVRLAPTFFTNVSDSGDLWAWVLFHEQVHFASRNSPAGLNAIGDKAYLELDPRKYRNLTTDQALKNADSYTNFARELLDPGFVWDLDAR